MTRNETGHLLVTQGAYRHGPSKSIERDSRATGFPYIVAFYASPMQFLWIATA